MGDGYAVTIIFKPNADLRSVTGDIENLCKDLNKEDEVVIVGKKTSHTNVKFVGLLWRRDKPWINRWVRDVNLLMGIYRAHIDGIDVSSIMRNEHTVHGLHLNPRGKDKLTRLIAESFKGRHIPVVMGVQNPFLS
ncbi:hypothetical protein B7P43_G18068 [Cryptotermes secundus]|uniref:Uncharacterized protein n=1 Tax=Cryptotermes secundus TaxID=105785 RepID=A0A2J7RS46_9NEOP|nr:hypothetical protein B7P43_G18068 [Cryptotermes secundus]